MEASISTDTTEYAEWAQAIAEVSESAASALVLGAIDTGKTTFCTLAANAALRRGRRVALIDGDVGQSEIGPPACVGLAVPEGPYRDPARLDAADLAFVGATSPRGRMLEHAAAMKTMADSARSAGAGLILADTTGFVRGLAARRLKQAKLTLLRPTHVVAIQRRGECEPILLPLDRSGAASVLRLGVPASIARKPAAFRAQRRAAAFARYFGASEPRTVRFEDVATTGTWLNTGTAVAPHLLKFLSDALGLRVYYAELDRRELGMVVGTLPAAEQGLATIHEQLRPETISLTLAAQLKHLLVGLSDGGRLVGIGTLQSVDFRRRHFAVQTPVRAISAVRVIQFGILRVLPDGTELGTIRPGEV